MPIGGVGLLSLRQGDLPRALPLLERAVGICQDADLPAYFPRMAAALGAAYTLGGRIADAVPLLTQAMEQATAMARVVSQVLCSLPLGEAHLLAGCLEEAHALAERALALARAYQERGNQAYALRLLGEIAARREPPEGDAGRSPLPARPSPWLTNWACARSRPTATAASACCMPGQVSGSRPAQPSRPPSSCTAPWR